MRRGWALAPVVELKRSSPRAVLRPSLPTNSRRLNAGDETIELDESRQRWSMTRRRLLRHGKASVSRAEARTSACRPRRA
jgi:hypothetical protein